MLVSIASGPRRSLAFWTHASSLIVMALLALGAPAAMAVPPVNDNFANATVITTLPFNDAVEMTEATFESGEPMYCDYSLQTVWYSITPTVDAWLRASTAGSSFYYSTAVLWRSIGPGIYGLDWIACSSDSSPLGFHATVGTTYYIQAKAPCCYVSGSLHLTVEATPPPVPVVNFSFYPSNPSTIDQIQFQDYSYDPGGMGIASRDWNFGDGATATGCCPTHRYAADGDYTVGLGVATVDGRTGSTSMSVAVRTHDVAITKFTVPQSASVGQTRQLSVGLRNSRYPETVEVQLQKGLLSGSFQNIGSLQQFVPVRSSNRTTDFNFSYTFTSDDARIGKVSFRAVANLLSGRDAFPADNDVTALSTKVNKYGASEAVNGESEVAESPARLALLGVTPNPARAGVDLLVRLSLANGATARLQLLDLAGRVMTERDLGSLGPGVHEARVAWGRRPAPGIYWVRLTQAGTSVSTRVGIVR